MEISVNDSERYLYDVIDLNSGKRIPYCRWADDEKGLYVVHLVDDKGGVILDAPNENGDIFPKSEMRGGKIKILKKDEAICKECNLNNSIKCKLLEQLNSREVK